jgi:hypothetical protein
VKNKNGILIIQGDDFKVFYEPFVYVSDLYYGKDGKGLPGKTEHKIPGRRQREKVGE